VDAPDAVCFRRRLGRDVHERARTPESIRYQYDTTVRPGAEQFVRPSRIHADLVVNGEHPIAHSVEEILRFIEKRKQQVSSVEFQERAGR
jgi:uridine kinase